MKIDHSKRLEEDIKSRTKYFEKQYGDIPIYKRSWERLLTDLYWVEHRQRKEDEFNKEISFIEEDHDDFIEDYIGYVKREGIPKKYCGLKHFRHFLHFKYPTKRKESE